LNYFSNHAIINLNDGVLDFISATKRNLKNLLFKLNVYLIKYVLGHQITTFRFITEE